MAIAKLGSIALDVNDLQCCKILKEMNSVYRLVSQ